MPISTKNATNVLIAQQAALRASMMDIKNFCEWNRMGRVAKGTNGDVREQYDRARAEGDKEKAANTLVAMSSDEMWEASVSGHPLLKNKIRNTKMSFNKLRGPQISIDDVAEFAETGVLLGEKQSAQEFKLPTIFEKNMGIKIEKFKEKNGISTSQKMAACGYIGKLTSVTSCMKNIDEVLQYAKPSAGEYGGTTAYSSFKRILSNKSYAAGLKTAVTKMYKKFKSRNVSGDLFSDIQSSFIEGGDSQDQAADKTWEVMAVLSATGPNMYTRVWDQMGANKNPNANYLAAIAAMIPHLDTDAMSGNPPRNYSLPQGVDFPCDSGKNYHFWMSAYLSRMLVKNGSQPEAATAAAYIAEIGYQTHSKSSDRSPNSISTWQRFGDTEIGVQFDGPR